MDRRNFIKTLGVTGLSVPLSTNFTFFHPVEKPHIEVSIFMTDKLQESINNYNKYFATKLIGEALDNALSSLKSDDEKISHAIMTETTIIDSDDINIDPEFPVGRWRHEIDNLVPKKEISKDSNILLSSQRPLGIRGHAEVPCESGCDGSEYNTSIILAGERFKNLTWEDKNGPWRLQDDTHVIATAIHEVGHNLGLRHEHGYGKSGSNSKPATVTPMLEGYIFNSDYQGIENFFGEKLPKEPGSQHVDCVSQFNDDISLDNLSLGKVEY